MPADDASQLPAHRDGPRLRDTLGRLLHVVDSTRAVCATVSAHFIDLDPASASRVGPDDLVTMVVEAASAGEAPIGPLRYRAEDPRFQVSADGHTAWATTEREPGVVDLIGVFDITPTRVSVGASRYGWIPGAGHVPSHLLLPDLEAMVAELRVYASRRALATGYTGRVHVTTAVFCDIPDTPIVLRRLDEATGDLLPDGEAVQEVEPFEAVYSMADSSWEVRRHVYALASRMATRFGASAPQFLADPDGGCDDDTPEFLI